MFVELVDRLRCVRAHEDSWLVASADRVSGRDVVTGTLGCPVCRAEYAVRDGAVLFADPPASLGTGPPRAAGGAADADDALRLAAMLDLREPGGFVLLAGAWGAAAHALAALVDVHAVALDPLSPVATGGGVSVVFAPPGVLPLAAGALRGAALDPAAVERGLVPPALRAVRPGGRLVAPASAPLPADVRQLARDERVWVAERTGATSAPIPLGLARRRN